MGRRQVLAMLQQFFLVFLIAQAMLYFSSTELSSDVALRNFSSESVSKFLLEDSPDYLFKEFRVVILGIKITHAIMTFRCVFCRLEFQSSR